MDIDINRQISVAIENQPGRLGQIGRLLAEQGIHISSAAGLDEAAIYFSSLRQRIEQKLAFAIATRNQSCSITEKSF